MGYTQGLFKKLNGGSASEKMQPTIKSVKKRLRKVHAEKKKERRHEKQSGKKNDNKLKAKFKRQTKVLAATQKRVAELEDQLAAKGERREHFGASARISRRDRD